MDASKAVFVLCVAVLLACTYGQPVDMNSQYGSLPRGMILHSYKKMPAGSLGDTGAASNPAQQHTQPAQPAQPFQMQPAHQQSQFGAADGFHGGFSGSYGGARNHEAAYGPKPASMEGWNQMGPKERAYVEAHQATQVRRDSFIEGDREGLETKYDIRHKRFGTANDVRMLYMYDKQHWETKNHGQVFQAKPPPELVIKCGKVNIMQTRFNEDECLKHFAAASIKFHDRNHGRKLLSHVE